MKILNKSSKKEICSEYKMCSNPLSKAMGLMFSRRKNEFCLLFTFKKEQHIDLHMLFVFYPIDVVFLDSEKKVVELKKSFKPFTLYATKHKMKYFLELPKGRIDDKKIKIADELQF
ncbi:MAG: DUF192 domain-containing protein [Nanoarchaeota archaeon]|nr:DUF192 domain-containing protein [Nanoarchaeota archaeon]